MIRDCLSLLGALALIGLAFAALRVWQQRQPPPSGELVRKSAHIATGVIASSFPLIFRSAWPGIALCSLALLGMIGMRAVPDLRRTFGRVTGSVDRQSWGEFYFPVAVGCVWVLSERNPVLFVIPVLLLTFGDAAAALVGAAMGRHKYRTTEGHKSVEGSMAFVGVSTAATLMALLVLAPGLDVRKAALVAALLACLLTIFEAIAWRGMDNLLLPIMAFVLLRQYLGLEVPQLGVRLVVLLLIVVLLIAIRKRRTLSGEGVLSASLVLYTAWALGGWVWLAPPAIVLLAAPWLPRNPDVPSPAVHGVFPVIALSGSGLVLLGVHVLYGADVWSPYVVTFGAGLCMLSCMQLHARVHRLPSVRVLACSLVLGIGLVMIPTVLVAQLPLRSALALLAIALATSVVTCGVAFMPALNRLVGHPWRWLLRGVALSIGSACATALSTVVPTSP